MDTSDRTIVLITGANRGIGYEVALAILKTQNKLQNGTPFHVIMGARDLAKGEEATKQALAEANATANGNTAETVQLDVNSRDSISAAAQQVKQSCGRVDILINNAGIAPIKEPSHVRMAMALETNVLGPYMVTDLFKPLLLTERPARAGGSNQSPGQGKRLIYVSSELGSLSMRSDPNALFYQTPAVEYRISKAGLNMMTICDSITLGPQGVKVFSWGPWYCATGLGGKDQIENRRQAGAIDPSIPAEALIPLLEGSHDDKHGRMVNYKMELVTW